MRRLIIALALVGALAVAAVTLTHALPSSAASPSTTSPAAAPATCVIGYRHPCDPLTPYPTYPPTATYPPSTGTGSQCNPAESSKDVCTPLPTTHP